MKHKTPSKVGKRVIELAILNALFFGIIGIVGTFGSNHGLTWTFYGIMTGAILFLD